MIIMNEIDFEECLKDSPAYRNQLRQATNHIDMLEDRLEQMSKSCNSVINNGKIFVQEFQKFLKCIYDVRELFSSDDATYKNLATFADYLREIQTLFSGLFEQTTNSVLRTLTRMVKEDIRKVKDQGKLFERLSSDYDIALQKNADASKTKL
jgi:archaellum component FlaC